MGGLTLSKRGENTPKKKTELDWGTSSDWRTRGWQRFGRGGIRGKGGKTDSSKTVLWLICDPWIRKILTEREAEEGGPKTVGWVLKEGLEDGGMEKDSVLIE